MELEKLKSLSPIKIWYCDGSCSKNPGPGGWGVLQLSKNKLNTAFYHSEPNTTNNRMELNALLYATQQAAQDKDFNHWIYTDSNYCVQIINEWARKWQANGWTRSKNQHIENLELVKLLWSFYSQPFFNISVFWTKGHDGTIGNELADRLAVNDLTKFYNILTKNNIQYTKNCIHYID